MPPVADPRYPIGKFTPPATITIADRKSAINALEKMPEYLRSALRDLDTIQLNTPYREGRVVDRQVVHHVARLARHRLLPHAPRAHRGLAHRPWL